MDITLSRDTHAEIGGRIQRSDGSPVPDVDVMIMKEDGSWFTTDKSDEGGYFKFGSLRPGKYVAAINLPGAPKWENAGGGGADVAPKTASLYYPGMQKRSKALVINLETDEKRDDINFIVPRE